MAHAGGHGRSDADQGHIEYVVDIDSNLVGGNSRIADTGNHQPYYREHRHFKKEGSTYGGADMHDLSNRCTLRRIPAQGGQVFAQRLGAYCVKGDEDRTQPHGDCRGPTTTRRAHFRYTQVAVDKDIVERNIGKETDHASDGEGPDDADTLDVAAQGLEQGGAGEAKGHRFQVAFGAAECFRVQ